MNPHENGALECTEQLTNLYGSSLLGPKGSLNKLPVTTALIALPLLTVKKLYYGNSDRSFRPYCADSFLAWLFSLEPCRSFILVAVMPILTKGSL